jgi:hypothetical protein
LSSTSPKPISSPSRQPSNPVVLLAAILAAYLFFGIAWISSRPSPEAQKVLEAKRDRSAYSLLQPGDLTFQGNGIVPENDYEGWMSLEALRQGETVSTDKLVWLPPNDEGYRVFALPIYTSSAERSRPGDKLALYGLNPTVRTRAPTFPAYLLERDDERALVAVPADLASELAQYLVPPRQVLVTH